MCGIKMQNCEENLFYKWMKIIRLANCRLLHLFQDCAIWQNRSRIYFLQRKRKVTYICDYFFQLIISEISTFLGVHLSYFLGGYIRINTVCRNGMNDNVFVQAYRIYGRHIWIRGRAHPVMYLDYGQDLIFIFTDVIVRASILCKKKKKGEKLKVKKDSHKLKFEMFRVHENIQSM